MICKMQALCYIKKLSGCPFGDSPSLYLSLLFNYQASVLSVTAAASAATAAVVASATVVAAEKEERKDN